MPTLSSIRYKFSANLYYLRRECFRLTQEELANELLQLFEKDGISHSITKEKVSRWENRTRFPTIDELTALSIFFQYTVDELIKDYITQKAA